MSRRHSVLIDARILPRTVTGVGRYLVNLLEEVNSLAPSDLEFQVLCFPAQDFPVHISQRALQGLGAKAKPLGLLQQVILPLEIKRARCDLFHYPSYDPPWSPVHPFVATCYDIEPLRYPALFPRRIVWYYRLFAAGLRRADRVIAISKNTGRDLVQLVGVAPERVRVVYLGVDGHFRPIRDQSVISTLRSRYQLPERYVLYLGNTMPHKNLRRLVQAMVIVRQHDPSVSLLLAGGRDKYRQEVEQAILTADLAKSVRFLGRVPESDLPALLSGALVFAFPSLYEGFGLPVLEAMACGTPVVTSNSSSLPEIVGEAGLMIDPRDTQALAEGILLLLQNRSEAERLSNLGIDRARRFTWRRCAEEHLTIYREALKR